MTKRFVLGPGTLSFSRGGKFRDLGSVEGMMYPAILPRDGEVIPYDLADDLQRASRLNRYVRSGTSSFAEAITMQIKFTNTLDRHLKKFQRQLRIYQDGAYFGHRIALLLHSTDPRQRKRGKRLRQKKFALAFRDPVDWDGEFGLNLQGSPTGRYRKD